MAVNDLVCDTELVQHAMPDSKFEGMPAFTITKQDETYLEDERDQSEMDDRIIGALKEYLEEIDIKTKELFKKIVSYGYVEMPLARLAREAIGESRAKDFLGKIVTKFINKLKAQKGEDYVVTKRGLSIDDELGLKLERFKVKTLNIGGVVEEDNKCS